MALPRRLEIGGEPYRRDRSEPFPLIAIHDYLQGRSPFGLVRFLRSKRPQRAYLSLDGFFTP
jgi:hypothetical protein